MRVKNHVFIPFRHPPDICGFFYGFRSARQRIKRGYADCDLWNFSEYLLRLFENALKDFADMLSPENETHSYPESYGNMENWVAELRRVSDLVSGIHPPFFIPERSEAEEEFAAWLRENFFDLWD